MLASLTRTALGALSIAAPDVEKARDAAAQYRRASAAAAANERTNTITDFEALRKVEVEKVAVLSFRSLQLERIAEMQDELLVLALVRARGETQDREKIDKALQNYGMIDKD